MGIFLKPSLGAPLDRRPQTLVRSGERIGRCRLEICAGCLGPRFAPNSVYGSDPTPRPFFCAGAAVVQGWGSGVRRLPGRSAPGVLATAQAKISRGTGDLRLRRTGSVRVRLPLAFGPGRVADACGPAPGECPRNLIPSNRLQSQFFSYFGVVNAVFRDL